ncbi:uncharacterized protein LOC126672292 [Mercurialis annua]|uniref:uncharacterized protein LOC126672292 n=1 Tax=Mercurialis annua TaxID=3986 RepID=UPI00215F0876|nr:uncharacterized protein LOC126672292 [Mercurialis annua]
MHIREYLTEAYNAARQNEFIALKQSSIIKSVLQKLKNVIDAKRGLQTILKNELSLYEGIQFKGSVEKAIEKEKLREELIQESKQKASRPQSHDSNFSPRQPASSSGSVASKKRSITFFECGGMGHIRRDCPSMAQFNSGCGRGFQGTANKGGRTSGFDRGSCRGSGFNANKEGEASTSTQLMQGTQTTRPAVQPRVFYLTQQEATASPDVISDLPVGESVVCHHVYEDYEIQIGDHQFEVDLVPLALQMFNVILGMDVLSKYKAVVDCYTKRKNVEKGLRSMLVICYRYRKGRHKLENFPVVNEFADVFADDLPDLPPDREIEFSVDLQLDINPISQAPYKMALARNWGKQRALK